MAYIHTCPHCGTQLSVNELPVEKTASRCPHCQRTIILLEYGAVLKKPTVYRCLKCNEELIYDRRPPFVHCDKCNSIYITSEHGNCLISPDIFDKGEKGELPYTKKKDRVIALKNKWRFLPVLQKVSCIAVAIVAICIGVSAYIWFLPPAIETSQAYMAMDSVWNEFRENNQYNIQMEGIAKFDDNSYLVLLSEPSSHVDSAQIHKLFKKYNCVVKTYKQPIGYDGWLKDAIVAINDIDPTDIPDLANDLSYMLYGTDYKAGFVNITNMPQHVAFSEFDLNQSVSEEELRQWFIEDKEPLISIEDESKESTLDKIMTEETDSSLYYSKVPGFVVWLLNKSENDEKTFRIAARKFALDTDLIFGAVSDGQKVAIIARERCVPIYELPPMRVETLCLLASTNEKELAQSYERNSMFAGKLSGGKDYAPIYLSDELWHTEYGSILNVTDQMLKSWSENGNIDYVDFNYPKPVNWAFDGGVCVDLGVSELTYNWNTAGTGYIVEDEKYMIYALNRTGSLPVSYIPGNTDGISENDKVYMAEQKAYDFFSYLSNPELVKVVQYVAMYQIFSNLEISIMSNEDANYDDLKMLIPNEYCDDSYSLLNKLANLDFEDMQALAGKYNCSINKKGTGLKINDSYYLTSKNKKVPQDRLALLDSAYYGNTNMSYYQDMLECLDCYDLLQTIDSLHIVLDAVDRDDTFMRSFSLRLIDRNIDVQYSKSNSPLTNIIPIDGISRKSHKNAIEDAYVYVIKHTDALKNYLFKMGERTKEQYRDFLIEANADRNSNWIKCPTIVLSWNLIDSTRWVGGHNLNSKVTRFKVSKEVEVGKPVKRDGKVEISAKDRASYISDQSYLRRVGRLDDVTIKGETVTVRSKSAITEVAEHRTARGFNAADHTTTVKMSNKKMMVGDVECKNLTMLLDEISKEAIHSGDVIKLEFEGIGNAGVDVEVVMNGLHATMSKGSNAAIPLSKYDFAHYSTKIVGDKAYVTLPIKPGELRFGSTSQVQTADMGGISNVKPKVNLAKGEVTFTVPKSKLNAFVAALKEFFQIKLDYMNEFVLKNLLRKHGINPVDCGQKYNLEIERRNLKVAFNEKNPNIYVLQYIQETEIA